MAEAAGAAAPKAPETTTEQIKILGQQLRQLLEEKGKTVVERTLIDPLGVETREDPHYRLLSRPTKRKEGNKVMAEIISIQEPTPYLQPPIQGDKEDILEIDHVVRSQEFVPQHKRSQKGTWIPREFAYTHYYFNTQRGELFNGNKEMPVEPEEAVRILEETLSFLAPPEEIKTEAAK